MHIFHWFAVEHYWCGGQAVHQNTQGLAQLPGGSDRSDHIPEVSRVSRSILRNTENTQQDYTGKSFFWKQDQYLLVGQTGEQAGD